MLTPTRHCGRLPGACLLALAALTVPVHAIEPEPAAARAGGIISFMVRDQRVRFAIDAAAAERAGLRLSSRLLDLAEPLPGGALRGGRKRR